MSWTVGAENGATISQFVITPSVGSPVTVPAGAVGSPTDPTPGASDWYDVTGLSGGTPVTVSVAGVNSVGTGASSTSSTPVTPTSSPTVPYPPTDVSAAAVPGLTEATVRWVVPADNGSAVSSFVITPSARTPVTVPAGATGSSLSPVPGATDSDTVGGLSAGQQYTFTVAQQWRGHRVAVCPVEHSVGLGAAPARSPDHRCRIR